jgi:hypothetical protein
MAVVPDVEGEGVLVEADAQAPSGPPIGHVYPSPWAGGSPNSAANSSGVSARPPTR